MSSNREAILADLEPLIRQAEREGKWLLSTYQAIEFSPKELRKLHAEGRFIWGAVNWRLINPPTPQDPQAAFDKVVEQNERLRKRLEAAKQLTHILK